MSIRETVRLAVRDKWRDGCARVCEIEQPDKLSNVCACDEMARLVADTLGKEQEGASEALPDRAPSRDTPIIREPDFAGRVRDFNEAVSFPLSPNAREAALRIARDVVEGVSEFNEQDMVIVARALLSPQDGKP